jgi:hypothetical protein
MRERFQAIEWDEPPIGDLVDNAVAQGRRMRTARRVRVGGGAGLAVLAVAGVIAGLVVTNPRGSAPAPAVVVAAPSAASSSAAPTGGPRVTATPAGLLELLLQDLPKGTTSHYAGAHQPDSADVILQTYLDRGHGPGMIRVAVIKSRVQSHVTWTPAAGGVDYLVRHVANNCLQSTVVVVRHPGNLLVQFDLSTCTPGSAKHPPQVLTVAEAVKIGADQRWGVSIDPALNEQGADRFPHLSTAFSGE